MEEKNVIKRNNKVFQFFNNPRRKNKYLERAELISASGDKAVIGR